MTRALAIATVTLAYNSEQLLPKRFDALLRQSRASGQGWKDWLRVLLVFVWSAVSYGLALWLTPSAGSRIPSYYALVVFVLSFSCFEEYRLAGRLPWSGVVRLNQGGSQH